MGIVHDGEAGDVFPTQADAADLTGDEFVAFDTSKGNHPSFDATKGEESAPTLHLVHDHPNTGCGMFVVFREDLDISVGPLWCPAPRGNLGSDTPDCNMKYRRIRGIVLNNVKQGIEGP